MNSLPTTGAYHDAIMRAAMDENVDIDKLQRLLDMKEQEEQRQAERIFNTALVDAEAEMRTIGADSNNPQTRSKYASLARLDSDIRPIYTKHGLGVSFNTEPAAAPDTIRVVGQLSHRQGGSRRFQIDMPIDTAGARGGSVMNRTHATGSAYTYGKRYLLLGMFNLSVGEEDTDGNLPRRPPSPPAPQQKPKPNEYVSPATGEVIALDHQTPGMLEWLDEDIWGTWAQRFMAHLRTSSTRDEVQQWSDLNTSTLRRLEQEKPAMAENVRAAIETYKDKLA